MKKTLVLVLLVLCFGCTLRPEDKYLAGNMVRIVTQEDGSPVGGGSGFLYEDGKVMTAKHVIEDATSVSLLYSDGTEETSTMWITSQYDIGIIYVKKRCDNLISWNINKLKPGTTVYTQGYPYRYGVLRLSKGVVSSTEWGVHIWDFVITVDANVSPGNSGGPLIDSRGRVCGIAVGYVGNVNLCVPGRLLFDFVRGLE